MDSLLNRRKLPQFQFCSGWRRQAAVMTEVKGVTGWRSQWTLAKYSTGPSTVSCAGTVQCRTVQWTPVVIARQVIGRCGVLGITIKWWRERGRTFRLSLVIKRQNSYSSFRKRIFYKINTFFKLCSRHNVSLLS